MEEGLVSETEAAGAANDEIQANGNGRVDAESLRRLRLIEFLRELVRTEGRVEAAKLLGVNYKTLVRAEESGHITGRMGDALERLLLSQDGPSEQEVPRRVNELEGRVAALEAELESLATEMRSGLDALRVAVEDRESVQGNGDQDQERDGVAERAEVAVRLPVTDSHRPKPSTERRPDREVVSEEPADDDPLVYGAAWPLVKEWRRLRASHPNEGTSLSWLAAEEKLLKLELAMLEEYGLTLPPETQPLRGFARRGQTSWRRTALCDARKARARRRLLRVLGVGLWWK
ncbi:MAG: hypothetical protein OXS35_07770 [Dehalococcoidia bacterium]|nr:hypothetical protein [Dehalococcoidia bacterium]